MNCPNLSELNKYVDSGVSLERANNIRDHIQTCPLCFGQEQDIRKSIGLVALSSSSYQSPLRRQRIEAAVRRSDREAPQRSFAYLWLVAGTAMAAGLVLLAVRQAPEAIFQERGQLESPERWLGLNVFRLGSDMAAPERVNDVIAEDDRLLFSYTNLSPQNMRWLSIVGVDSSGHLRWYQPARAPQPEGNGSLSIQSNVAGFEIREAIRLDLGQGPVRMVAVFSQNRLSRREVERVVLLDPEESAKMEHLFVQIFSYTVVGADSGVRQ